jgi:hypothetical protein
VRLTAHGKLQSFIDLSHRRYRSARDPLVMMSKRGYRRIKRDRIFARRPQANTHKLRIISGAKVSRGSRVCGDGGNKDSVSANTGDFQDLGHWVGDVFEINEVFGTILHRQFSPTVTCVDYNDSSTKVVGKLNALDPDAASTTHKNGPLTDAEAGGFD